MKNETFYDIIDNRISGILEQLKDDEFLKKQDTNAKKTYSFLYWFLEHYLPGQDISTYKDFVTEGGGDNSCDIFFTNLDQNGNEIYYVVQAKWFSKHKINSTNKITKEIKACLTDFRSILGGKKESSGNKRFNEQYKKFLEHKKNNGHIKFIFTCLCSGEIEINDEIQDFITPLVSFDLIDFQNLKQQYIEMEYKGVKTHNPVEIPYEPKTDFNLDFVKNQTIKIEKPYESYIFLIKPKQIFQMFEKYGQSIFYKNIRNPLPNSLFNKQISHTILNNPINFWYYNNGITAITDKIYPFHSDSTTVTIKGLQIINGAQTVFSIYETYKYASESAREKMDDNAVISIRIVTSGGEDFDLKVTRYTNSQNPISERDFHSNDKLQKRLQNEFFRNTNIWYETRRGEFRKKLKGTIKLTNELLAQNYLAYYVNDPFNAKQNRKKIFVSNSIDPKGLYEIVFNNNTQYDDMLLSYYLNTFISQKRQQNKSKIDKIDTEKMNNSDKLLLEYAFIQYSDFEIMGLFKILFEKIGEGKLEVIKSKVIAYFENDQTTLIQDPYDYIANFIRIYLNNLKTRDTKIVNSVLFKSKDFYPALKEKFITEINSDIKFRSIKL